jgi:putative hydroxymethylpyrimidine transport system permease protein
MATRGIARLGRAVVTAAGLLAAWDALVLLLDLPAYMLPRPWRVGMALLERADFLATHAASTLVEIVAGLLLGSALGCTIGCAVAVLPALRRWAEPMVVASQAIPVFAIAPLLVLWFGYGLASKIAMATLVVFFPVAIATRDGIAATPELLVRNARCMGFGAARIVWRVRLPAALPGIASGLRMAAALAPIGAVIGEWVGAAEGLGFVMMQANARMQTDLMFAALLVLATLAVALHAAVDRSMRRLVHWQPDIEQ